MKTYRIYFLKHPITEEIKYVGATTLSLGQRFSQHKYAALNKKTNTNCSKWIREVYENYQILPLIELIEIVEEENWKDREMYWISFYDNLMNMEKGGSGIIIDRSEDSIQRSSEAHFVPIVQFDINGNFVREWNSIKEASMHFGVTSESALGNALKNFSGVKTFKGFYWMYRKDYQERGFDKPLKKVFPKKVYQYISDGTFIQEYLTIVEAANTIGCYTSGISEALDKFNKKGMPKKCKGYVWKTMKI